MSLNILDTLHTYIIIRRDPKTDFWSTPQLTSRLDVSIGTAHTNFFLFQR